jgi:hypothetical protein
MLFTLSQEQRAYREAQRTYDLKLRELGPRIEALLDAEALDTDEAIEAYAEKKAQLYAQVETTQARLELQQAENALLRWGLAYLKQQPEYDPEVEPLFTSSLLQVKQKVLGLCMSIDAPGGVTLASTA